MDQEIFNISIRKFLKTFGVSSQREIEQAVRTATEAGTLAGSEALRVRCTLEITGLGVEIAFDAEIRLK
jgi:hypothetical protein